jgi:uncharacterized membrane protein YjdF
VAFPFLPECRIEVHQEAECKRAFIIVGWATTAVMAALSLWVAPPGSTYKFSFAILSPVLWLIYFLRRRLTLHPFHFALFAVAMLLHDLGSFGFYRRKFFGLEFDLFVHFYFGVVAGFVLYRALGHFYALAGWRLWIAVALLTLGIGGVHELIEWSTTLVMGPERGMLKMDPNDPFDTQKDLLNNLAGAMLATVFYAIARRSEQAAEQSNEAGEPLSASSTGQ